MTPHDPVALREKLKGRRVALRDNSEHQRGDHVKRKKTKRNPHAPDHVEAMRLHLRDLMDEGASLAKAVAATKKALREQGSEGYFPDNPLEFLDAEDFPGVIAEAAKSLKAQQAMAREAKRSSAPPKPPTRQGGMWDVAPLAELILTGVAKGFPADSTGAMVADAAVQAGISASAADVRNAVEFLATKFDPAKGAYVEVGTPSLRRRYVQEALESAALFQPKFFRD